MRIETVDVLILGAGPSGLSAGYGLTIGGISPLILEKEKTSGGLMRQIKYRDFILDIGRKELYSRIPEVDRLWEELLGDDYRSYPHRIGSLYKGHIYEMSGKYRGFRRGMPWGMFMASVIDLIWGWERLAIYKPKNYEEYWHGVAGRRFSRVMAQGYWEKFRGQKWSDMPVPEIESNGRKSGSYQFQAVKQALRLASGGELSQQHEWRHPAKGTGQISEILEHRVLDAGGRIHFESEVTEMTWSGSRIREVIAQTPSGKITYTPSYVVSSLPIELLGQFLSLQRPGGRANDSRLPSSVLQSVVLVYLFLDEEPRFPHAWLEVNDLEVRAGRITNYVAFNGDMVLKGQTCLCVEFFCAGADPLLEVDPMTLRDLALEECAKNQLVDPAKCYDNIVLKMPRVNPATSWRDWQDEERFKLLSEIKQFENLYHTNRPGIDKACYAGLEAANAILSGDRAAFEERTSPEIKAPRTRRLLTLKS